MICVGLEAAIELASAPQEFVVEKIRERILNEETVVELVRLVAEEVNSRKPKDVLRRRAAL